MIRFTRGSKQFAIPKAAIRASKLRSRCQRACGSTPDGRRIDTIRSGSSASKSSAKNSGPSREESASVPGSRPGPGRGQRRVRENQSRSMLAVRFCTWITVKNYARRSIVFATSIMATPRPRTRRKAPRRSRHRRYRYPTLAGARQPQAVLRFDQPRAERVSDLYRRPQSSGHASIEAARNPWRLSAPLRYRTAFTQSCRSSIEASIGARHAQVIARSATLPKNRWRSLHWHGAPPAPPDASLVTPCSVPPSASQNPARALSFG